MEIEILSLFPEYFAGPFETSILKRAQKQNLLTIRQVNIRDFADKRRQVDDRPFGGGPGMVLKPEPVAKAIQSVQRTDSHIVYLSPQGECLTAKKCRSLAEKKHLVLLCGHYEGVDERIIRHAVHEEISIGDYVLTNGGAAAIVVVDAVARMIPSVLGNEEACEQDSFQEGIFDCPHYTRPVDFKGWKVPEVLLNGNHLEIALWRRKQALEKTYQRRPHLYWQSLLEQRSCSDEKGNGKGRLELFLFVSDLNKSVRFYRKCMLLELLEFNEKRAVFSLGKEKLVLVVGVAQTFPLLRFVMELKEQFIESARRIQKEIPKKLQIISGEGEMQFMFSDPDGYPWMLVFPEGENK